MSTPESKAKDKVLKLLNTLKARKDPIFWQSQAGSQFGGVGLDLTVCYYGWFVAIEIKRFDKKGKLTLRQAVTMQEIKDAGGISRCIASETDLMELEFVFNMIRVYGPRKVQAP